MPEPSPRTLILVDVTTINHVAHLMSRWDHQTATEKGHNKDGTRLYVNKNGVTYYYKNGVTYYYINTATAARRA